MRYIEKYDCYIDDDCVLYRYAQRNSYGRTKGQLYRVKIGIDACGYPRASLVNHPYLHQIVYEAFVGHVPDDMTIDHIDRNKLNSNPNNLRLATRKQQADNTLKVDRGIALYGVRACDDRTGYGRAWQASHKDKCIEYCRAYHQRKRIAKQNNHTAVETAA